MGLSYDDCKAIQQKYTIKSPQEKAIASAGDFPNCKGLYPDCPKIPSLKDRNCRNCPKTDELEKPRLED